MAHVAQPDAYIARLRPTRARLAHYAYKRDKLSMRRDAELASVHAEYRAKVAMERAFERRSRERYHKLRKRFLEKYHIALVERLVRKLCAVYLDKHPPRILQNAPLAIFVLSATGWSARRVSARVREVEAVREGL